MKAELLAPAGPAAERQDERAAFLGLLDTHPDLAEDAVVVEDAAQVLSVGLRCPSNRSRHLRPMHAFTQRHMLVSAPLARR